LTTSQVQALSSSALRSLTSLQLQAMATDDLAALRTQQIAALSSTQIDDLTTVQIQALTSNQIGALTTGQVIALSSNQIQAILTTNIAGLQVAALDAIDTAFGTTVPFTQAQIDALLAAGRPYASITPLVIDLDGNGVTTLNISEGIVFDHDGDGKGDQTGWASSNDGLLVRDLNDDGRITDGSELFGSFSKLSDGSRARDGYEALQAFDSNSDGYVDSTDANYLDLMVWRDSNENGVTDQGELSSLADLGISRLGTNPTVNVTQDNGNVIGLTSDVVMASGDVAQMADVWFQSALTDESAVIETMEDVLARYAVAEEEPSSAGLENQTSDVSLALSSELQSFDQAGVEVDLTRGLSLVSAMPSGNVNDPEELLRKAQSSTLSGSLGQT